jgi:polyisoprenyl-teichoic acid--peptidoglycan teichoic acid transferase
VSLIPSSRRGTLARSAIAAAIVVAFTAAATAVAGLLQFKQFAKEIAATPPITHAPVTIADPGSPQTLLLIGSDHRAGEPFSAANTDTMMLVHIDPNSSTINLLSVPRDLKVQIPERGALVTDKLNATYSVGGPSLLVRLLKQQLFPGLRINHIIDVNFGGFESLVNAIGCVYTDVDRRYYNDTAYTNYSSIDIQPGYQKLCGAPALAFVRFRHTDTDIVRNARQQDFLRWAKAQFSPTDLVANRDKLLSIFGAHTQTDSDLHSVDGLINLFNLVAFSAGHTIKQVPFPAILQPCDPQGRTPCYVTADAGAERHAYRVFMTPTKSSAAGSARRSRPSQGRGAGNGSALTGDIPDGRNQAATLGSIGLPVYFPRTIASGSNYCTDSSSCPLGPSPNSYPRAYLIRGQNGNPYPSYRLTLVMNPALGQYYGVQGTTWQDAPVLGHPTETRFAGGKQLLLYINGGKLNMVAWRNAGAVYWISNTLTNDLSTQQMVGIAASLTR